jgi:hypothetical protein
MAFGNLVKKALANIGPDGAKISEMTGANTFGDVVKIISGQRPIGGTLAKSIPMAVDVSAEGMRKKSKTLAKGTGVTYSGIKTSSQGLLTGAKTEKKTLLGG